MQIDRHGHLDMRAGSIEHEQEHVAPCGLAGIAEGSAVAALKRKHLYPTFQHSGRYRALCPCCTPDLQGAPVKPTKRAKPVPHLAWRARPHPKAGVNVSLSQAAMEA